MKTGKNRQARDLSLRLGQVFMMGMPGPQLDQGTRTLLRDFNIGGIILFARNIQDPVQVARLCRDLQEQAMKAHGTPLFLAVDQEGGRVARLGAPFTVFPGNAAIGAAEEPVKRAAEFGRVTAGEMRLVGLNMDLAPVVDVRRGAIEKHLEGRSFGEEPEKVALLGATVIASLQDNGVMAVAKHFPGLGRASIDPHHHLPRIDVDRKEIRKVNLPPFDAAVRAGVCGIMTSHALYPALDPERPATLSPSVLRRLLRNEMGFEGLVLTDDLEMGAIATRWGVPEGAAMAFEAGADILLICEHQRNVYEAFELILGRLRQGKIPIRRLEDSCERVGAAKASFLAAAKKVSLRSVERYFSTRSPVGEAEET
ncbi:MAG: beta-N-acetylhexosaminidase [Thermodesulfobacteriota bacterium]